MWTFQRLDFDYIYKTCFMCHLIYYLFCKGSYIKSIDEMVFKIYVANDKIVITFAAETTG
jgi:hypothetical protein